MKCPIFPTRCVFKFGAKAQISITKRDDKGYILIFARPISTTDYHDGKLRPSADTWLSKDKKERRCAIALRKDSLKALKKILAQFEEL